MILKYWDMVYEEMICIFKVPLDYIFYDSMFNLPHRFSRLMATLHRTPTLVRPQLGTILDLKLHPSFSVLPALLIYINLNPQSILQWDWSS